jgi:23S rRNA-/tRNA-specific pseudouridylate synthase
MPPQTNLTIDQPIAPDSTSTGGAKFMVDKSGKEAITRIEGCQPLGRSHAQLTIRPLTGRTHQLRVHCAYIGHSIVGDKLYGSDEVFPSHSSTTTPTSGGNNFSARHALHCQCINFEHPWLRKECSIEAPLPNDMVILKELLLRT